MKKLLAVLIALLVITGCSSASTEKLVCTLELEQTGVSMSNTYTVTHSDDKVLKVNSVEEITIDDEATFTATAEIIKMTYDAMGQLDGYDAEVTIDGTSLKAVVDIDYAIVTEEALSAFDPSVGTLYNDSGDVMLEAVKATYEALGATCQ